MSAPFAGVLERPEEAATPSTRPLLHADFRLCESLEGTIEIQRGEADGSPVAPFAQFVSKTSHPMHGEGPTIFASAVTDRITYSGGKNDDSTIQDT